MTLYRKGINEPILYIPGAGGGLARSQDCCCCDGTTVTGCCLTEITPVLPPPNAGGGTYRTVTCETSTKCACDLLEGVTVTNCESINCCLDGDCSSGGNACECLNIGGTVVTNCVDCIEWEPGDPSDPPPDNLPGDTGTSGPGPGPCGANSPAASDCVYCRWALKNSAAGPCNTITQTYAYIQTRSSCQSLLNSLNSNQYQVIYYNNGTAPQFQDYVVYSGMVEFKCTPGASIYYYSNGIEYNDCGDITSYPDGKFLRTCKCTCP